MKVDFVKSLFIVNSTDKYPVEIKKQSRKERCPWISGFQRLLSKRKYTKKPGDLCGTVFPVYRRRCSGSSLVEPVILMAA
jgi:hypothetical protein